MEEKQRGKFKSFIYFGLIPLLIVFVLGLFLMNWLGFPVWETAQKWGNEVPVLKTVIPDPEPAVADEKDSEAEAWKQKYDDSNAKLKETKQELDMLKKDLEASQQEVADLKKSNKELQQQITSKAAQKNKDQLKKVAAIYENISPSKGASMLEAMSIEDAAITISMLDQDQQSNLLGSMKDTKKAAQITMLLKDMGTLNADDPALLKQQLHDLYLNQEDPSATLAETIAAMAPAQAAGIIQSMMETNSQAAMGLMKKMNTNSRSQVLTEIAKKDAKLAAQISVNLEK